MVESNYRYEVRYHDDVKDHIIYVDVCTNDGDIAYDRAYYLNRNTKYSAWVHDWIIDDENYGED